MGSGRSFQLACDVVWAEPVAGAWADLVAGSPGEAGERSDPQLPTDVHVRTLVAVALHEAGADAEDQIELSVRFVDAAAIAALNAEHREVDAPTDVLAFPIDGLDEELPPGMPRQLGDVVICPAYVADQVASGTTMVPKGPGQDSGDATLGAAVDRCVVHGVLHLAGFDHERGERDAEEMFSLEQLVLDRVRSAAVPSGSRVDGART